MPLNLLHGKEVKWKKNKKVGCKITVADTGMGGIPKDKLKTIFETI